MRRPPAPAHGGARWWALALVPGAARASGRGSAREAAQALARGSARQAARNAARKVAWRSALGAALALALAGAALAAEPGTPAADRPAVTAPAASASARPDLGLPVSVSAPAGAAPAALDDAALRAFLRELRCVVCQNESLADSTAPLAQDLKREIGARLAAGQTPDEVRAWLTARYGDFVSYRPPLTPATGLLWAGPAGLALLGVAVVWRQARRRGGSPGAADGQAGAVDAPEERNPA